MKLELLALFVLLLHSGAAASSTGGKGGIGINYGRLADNLPPPHTAVALMKQLGFDSVKIFDADATVLAALAGSGMKVTVMVPNDQIADMAKSSAAADAWVADNVAKHLASGTLIEAVMVGNEVLSDKNLVWTVWSRLVPAMEQLQASLTSRGLAGRVKVSTTVAMDVLAASYPPSAGAFKPDLAVSVMAPLLAFLQRTGSFYAANVYPYFAWSASGGSISLSYALNQEYPGLLDAMLDATAAALDKLGYGSVPIVLSETGWPNAGAVGASVENAAIYNNGLVRRTLQARGRPLPVFIFALFNENLKPGALTERHWGVAYPTGQLVYSLEDLQERKQ